MESDNDKRFYRFICAGSNHFATKDNSVLCFSDTISIIVRIHATKVLDLAVFQLFFVLEQHNLLRVKKNLGALPFPLGSSHFISVMLNLKLMFNGKPQCQITGFNYRVMDSCH